MKTSLPFALLAALALSSCSSAGRGVCNKRFECCSNVSRCDDINSEGAGYYDRCDIDYVAGLDKLGTYGNKACDDIAARRDSYWACLTGVACADVSTISADLGHVAKCDQAALDYCNALKASGDACGRDYRHVDCADNDYQANLYSTR